MWIRNAWYIASWAGEITGEKLFARTILGEPVILYRAEDGEVTALEDRCCHRHAPLSKGRLEGDAVRCMYHGVKFGPSGQCVEIPGETRIPKKYRVRRFPTVEKQKLVWIWMGDADLANPDDIVDWPYLDDAGWSYAEGYLHYKASYRLGVDNFLDFSHLPYVHENSLATAAYAELRPQIEQTAFGLRISNIADDGVPAPMYKKFGGFQGNVDRWSIYDYHTRGNCLLGDFGAAPVGEGGHQGDRKNAVEFRHISAMTPETETTSHYHFAQVRNFGLEVDGLDEKVLETVFEAFYEDREIIEAQQEIIDANPGAPMLPIAADKALIHIRRETDRIISAEQAVAAAAE